MALQARCSTSCCGTAARGLAAHPAPEATKDLEWIAAADTDQGVTAAAIEGLARRAAAPEPDGAGDFRGDDLLGGGLVLLQTAPLVARRLMPIGVFLVINNSITEITLGGGSLVGDLLFLLVQSGSGFDDRWMPRDCLARRRLIVHKAGPILLRPCG